MSIHTKNGNYTLKSAASQKVFALNVLIEWIQRFVAGALFLLILVLIALYFAASYWEGEFDLKKNVLELAKDVITNTIPSIVVVAFSFLIFNKLKQYLENTRDEKFKKEVAHETYQAIKPYFNAEWQVKESFNKIDWEFYFKNYKDIVICVHYFGSWISTNKPHLRSFFKNKGKLTIILPDESNNDHLKIIADRFDKKPSDISTKITDCKNKLNQIKENAKHGELNVIQSENFHWTCYVLFDDKKLIISPYEGKVQGGIDAPGIEVDIQKNPHLTEWIRKEINHLKKQRVNNNQNHLSD